MIPEMNGISNCCRWNTERLIDGELVDTYGGNYTYQYRYKCNDCGRVWEYFSGAKPRDAEYVDA